MDRTRTSAAKKNTVVALSTSVGDKLFVRSNPSDDDVRNYVENHTKRYLAGEPGGPSGLPAFRIFDAKRYPSEDEYYAGTEPLGEIDIADLLPTP